MAWNQNAARAASSGDSCLRELHFLAFPFGKVSAYGDTLSQKFQSHLNEKTSLLFSKLYLINLSKATVNKSWDVLEYLLHLADKDTCNPRCKSDGICNQVTQKCLCPKYFNNYVDKDCSNGMRSCFNLFYSTISYSIVHVSSSHFSTYHFHPSPSCPISSFML